MASTPTIVALIPARGGSKRLPGKNVLAFAGRPLLYYSIALAQAVERIQRCLVSTEDGQIAHVARNCGAEVITRPAELADDTASTAAAVVHALETLKAEGRMPDAYVLLQPNCPLRTRSMVVRALELLENGGCDSVVSVSRHHHKIGEIRNELFVPAYAPGTRSQEMPERYFENGLVYVAWSRVVMEGGGIFGARIRPLITDPIYALGDIDTKLDLEVAEFLFAKYRSHFDWAPSPLTVNAENRDRLQRSY
jgi:N-acylneuraminate cytidylyltransferase